eukprot:139793_1
MAHSLEYFREQNKLTFERLLNKETSSKHYQRSLLKKLGDGAKVVQYNASHKHQSLQILSYMFSSMGSTNHAKILMLSTADHYAALSYELDHLAKTGLGFVMLDKNNNVCLVCSQWDHCDRPKYKIVNNNVSKKSEICTAALNNHPLYQQLITQSDQIKYGELLYLDKIAVRPDLMGKGVPTLDLRFPILLKMGYINSYNLATSPKSIAVVQRMVKQTKRFKLSMFDFSTFQFKDGTSIDECYKRLEEANFDVVKLKQCNSKIGALITIGSLKNKNTQAKL